VALTLTRSDPYRDCLYCLLCNSHRKCFVIPARDPQRERGRASLARVFLAPRLRISSGYMVSTIGIPIPSLCSPQFIMTFGACWKVLLRGIWSVTMWCGQWRSIW